MQRRFLVALLAALTTLSPAALLENAAPASAVLPVTTADPCGGFTFHPGAIPNYNVTGINGAVTSFSGNPADGFEFTFDNPFPDGANYNYQVELYGDNGPLYYAKTDSQNGLVILTSSSPSASDTLIGSQGGVWFSIPQEFLTSMTHLQLTLTLTSLDGHSATNGWARAQGDGTTASDGSPPSGC
jgi:hypothetical protein